MWRMNPEGVEPMTFPSSYLDSVSVRVLKDVSWELLVAG